MTAPTDLVLLAPGAQLVADTSASDTPLPTPPDWRVLPLATGEWPGLCDAIAALAPQWLQAEQVLLLLPGMRMAHAEVGTLFQTMRAHDLALAQPSLSWASEFSDPVCLHNPAFVYRHTNRVDPHALGFRRDALQACLPVMAALPEPAAWARLLPAGMPEPVCGAAVVDAAQARRDHPPTADEQIEPEWPSSLPADGAHREPGHSWGGLGQRGQAVSLFDDTRETFVGLLASGLACAVREPQAIGELVLDHLLRGLDPAPRPLWGDEDPAAAAPAAPPAIELRRSPILAR